MSDVPVRVAITSSGPDFVRTISTTSSSAAHATDTPQPAHARRMITRLRRPSGQT